MSYSLCSSVQLATVASIWNKGSICEFYCSFIAFNYAFIRNLYSKLNYFI